MAEEVKNKALLIDAARLAYQDFGQEFWDEFADRLRLRLGEEKATDSSESGVVEPAPRRTT